MTAPVLRAEAATCCGGGGGGGGCPHGFECLPSNYIDPADCPAGGLLESPADVADLAQWYDASDDASFTFVSGTDVDVWADKSGNGHDLTAYQFDSDRPTRIANALSGLHVVADTSSNMATAAYAYTGPRTVIAVAYWNNQHGAGATEAAVAAANVSGIVWRGGGGDWTALGSGGGGSGGFIPFDSPHIVTAVIADADSLARLDMVEVDAGDYGIWDQTAFYIFGDSGANRALRGYIAELVVYDRALTADEVLSVEDYLLRKWIAADNGVVASYVPYAINAGMVHPSKVDELILSLTPWGYWKMDDASGAPQDSSGNGRHASVVSGSVTYSEPPLTTQLGDSIALTTHTTCIGFPVLVSKMSDFSLPFTLIGVAQFDDTSDGNPNGSIFISEQQGSTATMFGMYFQTNSDLWLIINQAAVSTMDSLKPGIGNPFVWAIRASGFDVTVYINGVVAATGFRGSASYSEIRWSIGISGFFSNPLMHISNVAAWDSALDEADLMRIVEAMVDEALLANAYRAP